MIFGVNTIHYFIEALILQPPMVLTYQRLVPNFSLMKASHHVRMNIDITEITKGKSQEFLMSHRNHSNTLGGTLQDGVR